MEAEAQYYIDKAEQFCEAIRAKATPDVDTIPDEDIVLKYQLASVVYNVGCAVIAQLEELQASQA